MVAGRTSESRTASVTTTNLAATITAAAGTFNEEDAGLSISAAAGIPADTTILSVQSDTGATMSANASASCARTATIGGANTAQVRGTKYGFIGWSPETDAESEVYVVSSSTDAPDRITNPITRAAQRARG